MIRITKSSVFALAAMLMLPFVFSSCGDDDWWSDGRLVGVWHTRDDYGTSYTEVRFYDNGEGRITQYDYGHVSDYADFDWQANRRTIYFRYYDRPDERWEIEFDGRNAFRLYFDDGSYTYFVRDY